MNLVRQTCNNILWQRYAIGFNHFVYYCRFLNITNGCGSVAGIHNCPFPLYVLGNHQSHHIWFFLDVGIIKIRAILHNRLVRIVFIHISCRFFITQFFRNLGDRVVCSEHFPVGCRHFQPLAVLWCFSQPAHYVWKCPPASFFLESKIIVEDKIKVVACCMIRQCGRKHVSLCHQLRHQFLEIFLRPVVLLLKQTVRIPHALIFAL